MKYIIKDFSPSFETAHRRLETCNLQWKLGKCLYIKVIMNE